jgi:hypothetical protein
MCRLLTLSIIAVAALATSLRHVAVACSSISAGSNSVHLCLAKSQQQEHHQQSAAKTEHR